MTPNINNNRNQNIETLRTFSMIGIVTLHYIYHGLKSKDICIYNGSIESFIDYSLLEILYVLASTSVNCYVLISGYFLINKSKHRIKQLINLWIQVGFYSLIIGFLSNFHKGLTFNDLLYYIFPIQNNMYWFITTYFGLIIISPYLSVLASHLSKKQHLILIIILSIITIKPLYGNVYANFDSILYFSLLFFIGGYFKLYDYPLCIKNNLSIFIFGTLLLFSFLVIAINSYRYIQSGESFQLKSTAYNDIILILSVFIFLYFTARITVSKHLSYFASIAPYTLGVYLIHDNPYLRTLIWEKIMPTQFNTYVIMHCIGTVITIFLTCIVIEYCRAYIFQKLHINYIVDILYNKVGLTYKSLSKKLE